MNNIRIFDYFGFTPQFLIGGENKYKSLLGGVISLFFILVSLIYSVFQFFSFFDNINILETSRSIIKPSKSYNLSSKDIYFGVGLTDLNRNEYNISRFPYLTFQLEYFQTDQLTMKQNKYNLNLGSCNISKFLPLDEYDFLTQVEKDQLKKK